MTTSNPPRKNFGTDRTVIARLFEEYKNIASFFFLADNPNKIHIVLDCFQAVAAHKLFNFIDDLLKLIKFVDAIDLSLVGSKELEDVNTSEDCYNKYTEGRFKIFKQIVIPTSSSSFFHIIGQSIKSFFSLFNKSWDKNIPSLLFSKKNNLKKITMPVPKRLIYDKDQALDFRFDKLLPEKLDYNKINALDFSLEKISRHSTDGKSTDIQKAPRNNIPLSDGQLRLSYLEGSSPNISPYNWLMSFQIDGDVNPTILEKCIQSLIERHESLRTGIDLKNQIQTIAPPKIATTWHLKREFKLETDIKSYCEKFTQEKFDLSNPPLIRSVLIENNDKTNTPRYYWLCSVHHSVFDGYSQIIFLNELSSLYNFASRHNTLNLNSLLPKLNIHFADYNQWNNDVLKHKKQQQLDFWKEELKDLEPVKLPTDFPRPRVKTFEGDRIAVNISNSIKSQLNKIAKEHNVTLYTCLLTAFQIFLHKYTLLDDISCGTMTANRKKNPAVRDSLAKLTGFVANNIVVRTKFRESLTVIDLINEVKDKIKRTIHENSDVPFGEVVKEIKPHFDPSSNPLFENLFVFQDSEYQNLQLSKLKVEPLECGWGISPFDLTLELRESIDHQTLTGFFDYNTNLFATKTIRRMVENFTTLLEDFAKNPQKRIADLEIISPIEKQTLRCLMMNPSKKQNYLPMHQVIEQVAQKNPNKIAVIFENAPGCTYYELDARANQLAHFLIKNHKVKPGDVIPICLKRSEELVIAILAAWKAGAVIACLETKDIDAKKIEHKLDVINPYRIIAHPATLALIPKQHQEKIISFDNKLVSDYQLAYAYNDKLFKQAPDVNVTANDLAMITFTSGTTSKTSLPKAIKIKHAGLHNWITFYQKEGKKFGILPVKNVFLSLDMAFDGGICEMFCQTLGHGSTLCINSEENQFNAAALKKFFSTHKIQLAEFTPTLLKLFKPEDLPSVTHIFVIGEAFPKSLIQPWIDAGVTIINGYGPSETTIGCILYVCEKNAPIYIGKPISNMRPYVLDQNQKPVPIGVWGELYISGVGIADGYLNQPELTKEVFIKDPFAPEVGAIMYKTGDLVRFVPDGNIEFKGRIKASRQVKLYGNRIELDEIEGRLLTHHNISNAAVITSGELEKQFLSAFIVSKDGSEIDTQTIRHFLLENGLWAIKIPSLIINLKALPFNTNGKLDTKELANLALLQHQPITGSIKPANEIESKILEILKQMFDYEDISTDVCFREIGGSSIQIFGLINSLNNTFFKDSDITIDLTDFADFRERDFNIQQLATIVATKQATIKEYAPEPVIAPAPESMFENPFNYFG